jgi:hypothetical protein
LEVLLGWSLWLVVGMRLGVVVGTVGSSGRFAGECGVFVRSFVEGCLLVDIHSMIAKLCRVVSKSGLLRSERWY